MPRRRKLAHRCQSIPTQSNAESGSGRDITSRSEPIVERAQSNQRGSHDQSDSHEQLDPSIEANSDIVPDRPCHKKRFDKYWTVSVIDENGETREARLKAQDLFVRPSRGKIVVDWNKEGQPIGESGGLLGQFLGQVANNVDNFPISYEKWTQFPKSCKDHVWTHVIREKFVVNDGPNKKYIIGSLGKKWKDNRAKLYNAYYDPTADWDTNVQNHPDGISRDHWAGFLTYRLRQSTKDMCERNTENRKKQKVPHTLGSKSIARKKHEMETELGRSMSRAELWSISHKKKDGSFVNDEAKEKSEELDQQKQISSENDAFTKVFGKEHPGRVRSMGYCVCPSQYLGSSSNSKESRSSQSNAEIEELKSQLQANNAEMKVLKAQMDFFMEHFGAQMPPSNLNNNQVADVSSPVLVRRSSSDSHEPRSLNSQNQNPFLVAVFISSNV
ncbi:hypothetical protein CDL12_18494 [Handroanthus impetiginosus]|uniref:Transposase Tnp1/En/Spm-like domain-containing protein n=1 Tax=Handroanthus impetiginosus TaxID=429701 RepID=A0A2G9GUN4_9LAMI|nr:hypothetical protein CDL12_18494 [Handroanthus impetiginosus]